MIQTAGFVLPPIPGGFSSVRVMDYAQGPCMILLLVGGQDEFQVVT